MPIRTGLDDRLNLVRDELKNYFGEAKEAYSDAIDAFTKLDSQVYSEVKKIRQHAREVNWDLTNDLLLILALNQPLIGDLRVVAAYLRSDRSIDENADELPEVIVKPVLGMHTNMDKLVTIVADCLTEMEEIPAEEIRSIWTSIKESHKKAVDALSSLDSETMGGKASRLEVVNIVSRVERSAYNVVRLASLWHHALNNENIILDA